MQAFEILLWLVNNHYPKSEIETIFAGLSLKERGEILKNLIEHKRDYQSFDRIAVRKTDCVKRLYAIKALRETTGDSLSDCCQHFKEIMESETPLFFYISADTEQNPTNRTKLLASFGEAGLIAYPAFW